MSSITTATTTVNRQQIFVKTIKFFNSNSLHFITLSLLFLPFTFSISTAINYTVSQNLFTFKTLTTLLAISVAAVLSTVAGIASITYSTHQAFHRKPLTFISVFKSLSHSFIPLLSTFIAGFIKLAFVFILITLSPLAVTEAVNSLNLGFHVNQSVISTIANTIGVITVLYFVVIWGSAAPISVLESKSGFTPLTESANQPIKFRYISVFRLIMPVSVIISFYSYHVAIHNIGTATKWHLILQLCVNYLISLLMNLLYVVENTVLYLLYKVVRGEDTVKTTVDSSVLDDYSVFPQGFTCTMLIFLIIWCITHFVSVSVF